MLLRMASSQVMLRHMLSNRFLDICRAVLLESGLAYILVEMLRNGYCDTRVVALQHISDLVKYGLLFAFCLLLAATNIYLQQHFR